MRSAVVARLALREKRHVCICYTSKDIARSHDQGETSFCLNEVCIREQLRIVAGDMCWGNRKSGGQDQFKNLIKFLYYVLIIVGECLQRLNEEITKC